ncbi:MAG: ribose-phosphate pyrophosphokinase [Leptotrichiaceae bacterium]|nr:ribose-phosphate pyrophosphokinase [Leptotrichiaceae bacterium]
MEIDKNRVKIFAGSSSKKLASRITEKLETSLSEVQINHFADGEVCIKPESSVRGCKAFLINSTSEPVNESIMELLIMIDALKRASAYKITAVIPYYGYARQDRTATSREPITAKLVANLLTKAGATRVVCMDLHAKQVQGFFDIPADHMEALPIFVNYFMKYKFDPDEVVVVSPNAGGLKRARGVADWLHTSLAIIDKRDDDNGKAEIVGIIGDVKGKKAILVDDIINTATTICGAANELLKEGATEIYACATHGIFSEQAVELLKNTPFTEVIITDTIEIPENKKFDKLTILSTDTLFAETIKRISSDQSISDLFIRKE